MKLKSSDGGLLNSGIDDLIRCYAIKLISYISAYQGNKTYKIGSAWLFGGNVLEYFVLNNSLMSAQDRITSSHYALLFRDIHLLQG